MNRNDFLNMIEDSVPVNRQMMAEIYELIDIFPYFQSAHMLLLKGLQNNSDVKFENQLRNSAIHIADREVLYYLLKQKSLVKPEPEEVHKDTESAGEVSFGNQQTVIESAKNSEHLINEIEKNYGEPGQNDEQNKSIPVQRHPVLISAESDIEGTAGVMLLMDEESAPVEEKVFFMDPGFSIPDRGELLELDLDENETFSTEAVEVDHEPDYPDKPSEKQLQSELIEKFIISNPRIEPNREKTNLQSEDISKLFVVEDGGFVTETLARIFINQGYYSKAIDIYEKLSLKFPEKSSYFASQIEKVKEYIKK